MNIVLKAIKNPDRAFRALLDKSLSTFGHLDFKPFIVLSRSRTGSNMLISLLNSHPNIKAEGEIFSNLNGRNYKNILASAFDKKQPYYVKSKGFKIFYYHPQDDLNSNIWNDLVNMESLHVIHLKRRDIFRTLISKKIASLQDVWLVTGAASESVQTKKKAVSLTVQEIRDGIHETKAWEQEGNDKFSDHPLLDIYYEDLVADPTGQFERITDFLDVHPVQPRTELKKQNPGSLSDLVSNYDELKSEFNEEEWKQLIGI